MSSYHLPTSLSLQFHTLPPSDNNPLSKLGSILPPQSALCLSLNLSREDPLPQNHLEPPFPTSSYLWASQYALLGDRWETTVNDLRWSLFSLAKFITVYQALVPVQLWLLLPIPHTIVFAFFSMPAHIRVPKRRKCVLCILLSPTFSIPLAE